MYIYRSSCKVVFIPVIFEWNFNFLNRFLKNTQMLNLIKIKRNTNLMPHCAGFISAGSLYMFRAQAPIIRSI